MNPKARKCADLVSVLAMGVLALAAGLAIVIAFETAFSCQWLLAVPGVPHEPEAAGGVDLQAGLQGIKKGLAGGGFSLLCVVVRSLPLLLPASVGVRVFAARVQGPR
jgi:hypothetical protein